MWYRHLPYDNTGVTVELGRIVEMGVKVFDFDYPVPQKTITYNGKTAEVDFDKERLEQKIIDHYRFHQIGQETVGRFKHCLKTRMREIMPYFVQLYEFDAIFKNIEDPLESYHLEEVMDRLNTGENKSNSTTSGQNDSTNRFSNTPQGDLDNMDKYLTEATKDTASSSATANASINDKNEEKYTLIKRGNIGVQPLGGEVENIRNAFINIDMQIIEELKDLFLMVY